MRSPRPREVEFYCERCGTPHKVARSSNPISAYVHRWNCRKCRWENLGRMPMFGPQE